MCVRVGLIIAQFGSGPHLGYQRIGHTRSIEAKKKHSCISWLLVLVLSLVSQESYMVSEEPYSEEPLVRSHIC